MGRPHSPWLQNVLAILPWAEISWKFSRNKKGYKKNLNIETHKIQDEYICAYIYIYLSTVVYQCFSEVSDALRYESSFQELHRG